MSSSFDKLRTMAWQWEKKMLSKKFIAGIFLIFIALLFVITILTSSINPFEANVLGHIIDLDYLEAGALLFGVTGLTFVLRDISERE